MLTDDPPLSEILSRSMRRLSRVPRTEVEERARLQSDGAAGEHLEKLVAELRRLGFLDDRRLAEAFARNRFENGYGTARVKDELLRRGVEEGTIDAALEALSADYDEVEILRSARDKWLRTKGRPRTPRQLKNLSDFLVRRGFHPETVRDELADFFDRVFGQ